MPAQFAADAAEALEAVYAQYGVPALWGVAGVSCTVVKTSPDEEVRIGEARAVAATNILLVRVAEVAAPARADQVQLLDPATLAVTGTFKILGAPQVDDFDLEWRCEAAAVA